MVKKEDFVSSIKDKINVDFVDVVICPNFVSLYNISNILEGTNIKLASKLTKYKIEVKTLNQVNEEGNN